MTTHPLTRKPNQAKTGTKKGGKGMEWIFGHSEIALGACTTKIEK
jgi:hypothetical protein